MSDVTVSRSVHGTLTAATEYVVEFAQHWEAVEVLNRGGDDIFFRVDGIAAEVGADDTFVVQETQALRVPFTILAPFPSPQEVSLISAGAANFSVTGISGS